MILYTVIKIFFFLFKNFEHLLGSTRIVNLQVMAYLFVWITACLVKLSMVSAWMVDQWPADNPCLYTCRNCLSQKSSHWSFALHTSICEDLLKKCWEWTTWHNVRSFRIRDGRRWQLSPMWLLQYGCLVKESPRKAKEWWLPFRGTSCHGGTYCSSPSVQATCPGYSSHFSRRQPLLAPPRTPPKTRWCDRATGCIPCCEEPVARTIAQTIRKHYCLSSGGGTPTANPWLVANDTPAFRLIALDK